MKHDRDIQIRRRSWPPTAEQFAAAREAVMAEVERINAAEGALSEEEKHRRRAYWARKDSSIQVDRDRYLDECGITAGEAYGDEHPMQSGSTNRRF